jgi:hypothetical protein
MNTNNMNTPLSNRSDGMDTGSMYPSIPSNRPFIPPTPASVNSEMDSSTITSIQQNDPRRNVVQQLALLLHAHKCLQRERQAQNFNGDNHAIPPTTMSLNPCPLPHCATMRTVLQHMTKCTDLKNCSCKFSLGIIYHFCYLFSQSLRSISSYNPSLEELYDSELFDMWLIEKTIRTSTTEFHS